MNPLPYGPLFVLAVVLISGMAGGSLARRLRLPGVTGQILAGVLIGGAGLDLFHADAIDGLRPVTEFALGLIAVTVGSHLHFRRLRNAGRRLLLLLLAEVVFVPLTVFLAIQLAGTQHWTVAVLMGAIAVATAPATILAVTREAQAKGVFVKTLIAAVALNNMACIILFEVAHAASQVALDSGSPHTAVSLWVRPLRQLVAAGGLGIFSGVVFNWITPYTIRFQSLPIASLILILATWGTASTIGISPLLASMFLGVTLVNINPRNQHLTDAPFARFEAAILAAFFTLAGMSLEFKYLAPAGLLAIWVVAGRFTGKYVASFLSMSLARATPGVRRYLGVALIPQAGIAVGLILIVEQDPALAEIRNFFLALGLAVVTINEIIGPFLTRAALSLTGEAGKDRPRLIDFLHEENISTDFEAATKEEAITRLTDLLINSNHLKIDRDQLLKNILDREAQMSTCVGDGLAIPHGTLESGDQILGVMAVSRKGLSFDTPDGRPVHCMVLLVTPPSRRDHHLEVLAAITRVVSTDARLCDALFNAESAAHVYDLLHAEEAEDFNYFLE